MRKFTVVSYYRNKEKDKVVVHAYGLFDTRRKALTQKAILEKRDQESDEDDKVEFFVATIFIPE